MGLMTGFNADEGLAHEHDRDLSSIPRDLEVYAHIEGLVGEENELLEQAEEARKEEHRERLHAITGELDRVWETLRRRAERRAKPGT
jgi:predicted nuclease with TOPRIM domain